MRACERLALACEGCPAAECQECPQRPHTKSDEPFHASIDAQHTRTTAPTRPFEQVNDPADFASRRRRR
jgi:hypothetical protein